MSFKTMVIPGRLTYVNDAQDMRILAGAKISIDGYGAMNPYQVIFKGRQVGLPVASYEEASKIMSKMSV